HALLRITSPKLRRPRRLLPSRERVRSSVHFSRSVLVAVWAGVAPEAAVGETERQRLSRVVSRPSPSLSEVALLSHSPCSPSEREAGQEATRFHNFSRRRDGRMAARCARAAEGDAATARISRISVVWSRNSWGGGSRLTGC